MTAYQLDLTAELRRYNDWIEAMLRPHLGSRILELGAGTGTITARLARYGDVVAVEPEESPYISQGIFKPHRIMGTAPGFVPETLDKDILDEIYVVTEDQAFAACRQLANRMTIHSDGRVALCDQDWLGRACVGDANTTPLAELWSATRTMRLAHDQGRWDESELCRGCHEWHRP